jgi:hypothetical protein
MLFMLHISQMIEQSAEAVSQIKVKQGHCLMSIMQEESFTQEQKLKLVELLKPLDAAISAAQSSFSHKIASVE